MNATEGILPAATEAVGWTLLHFLWQGAAVGLLLATLLSALRRRSARVRYLAACAALAAMALCPIVTLSRFVTGPPSSSTSRDVRAAARTLPQAPRSSSASNPVRVVVDASSEPDSPAFPQAGVEDHVGLMRETDAAAFTAPWPAWGERIRPFARWLVLTWVGGVVVLSLRLVAIWLRVERLRQTGVTDVAADLKATLARLKVRLGLSRPVALLQSSLVEVPTVIGWLSPVILLPAGILVGLTPVQLEALLVHELAHIRRWDYIVNLAQNVVETLLFYHPAIWWVSARIRQERENCCDDLAAAVCGDQVGYAEALLRMEELRPLPGRIALAARGGDLLARIQRLLGAPERDRLSPWWPSGVLALGALALIPLGFWSVSRGGQEERADEPVRQIAAQKDSGEAASGAAVENRALNDAQKDVAVKPRGPWHPIRLANEIEQAMRDYDSTEYSIEYTEKRNAEWRDDLEPKFFEGKGHYTYRGDGTRWFLDELGFTHNSGTPIAIPEHRVSGYDGRLHYHARRGTLWLAEDEQGRSRAQPRSVFWHAGLTYENLLAVLRKGVGVVSLIDVDNRPCVHVSVDWADAWDESKAPRRLEVTISPEQSFLPLKTVWTRNEKLQAQEELSELKQTPDGLWYPTRITEIRPGPKGNETKQTRVTSLVRRGEGAGKAFRDEEFQYGPPAGTDIVDRRRGYAWHDGPWWQELSGMLRERFNWPRPSERLPQGLSSFCDPALEGQAAPAIEAAEWLNGDPGTWNRQDRFVSVLFFWTGSLIQPNPEWVTALSRWQERWRDDGVELIGIVTSGAAEQAQATMAELELKFPVAISKPSEGGDKKFGKTFDAFRLQAYTGLIVVDPSGKIRRLGQPVPGQEGSHPLETLVTQIFDEAGRKPRALAPDRLPLLTENGFDRHLEDAAIKPLETEWKRLRRSAPARARVTGQLKFGEAKADDGPATAMVLPQLRLMNSHIPGGHFVISDYERKSSAAADAEGKFVLADLTKGTYTLTIARQGFATVERDVIVAEEDSVIDAGLLPMSVDWIAGTVVAAGKPIAGATVTITQRFHDPANPLAHTTAHLPRESVTSDAEGRFVYRGLYEGRYTLEIAAPGFQTLTLPSVPLGDDALRKMLPR